MSPVTCRYPRPPSTFPCPPLDFSCPGEVPAPEETETVGVGEEGKGEPREDGERQQKMELFVKESFEAKDELFPEKSRLLEELPADVNAETEDQGPGGVLPDEAPTPATLGATWEGNVISTTQVLAQGSSPGIAASESRACTCGPRGRSPLPAAVSMRQSAQVVSLSRAVLLRET